MKYITIITSSIALLISTLSYINSVSFNNDERSISAANLIFPENEIIVSESQNGNDTGYLFTPIIKNIGNSPASTVHLKGYVIYVNEKYYFSGFKTKLVKMFDEKIIHNLQPESSTSFGSLYVSKFVKLDSSGESLNLVDKKNPESIALFYSLEYDDRLLDRKTTQCYAYEYTFGADKVHTLTDSKYKKLVKRLEEYRDITNDTICSDFSI